MNTLKQGFAHISRESALLWFCQWYATPILWNLPLRTACILAQCSKPFSILEQASCEEMYASQQSRSETFRHYSRILVTLSHAQSAAILRWVQFWTFMPCLCALHISRWFISAAIQVSPAFIRVCCPLCLDLTKLNHEQRSVCLLFSNRL